jgi:hypothetical protein
MSDAMDVDTIPSPASSNSSLIEDKYWPWQTSSASDSVQLCVCRILAALATLPEWTAPHDRVKFGLGIDWEVVSWNSINLWGLFIILCSQRQVASAIGIAAIQNKAVKIPELVKKALEMVMKDDGDRMKSLDELYTFAVDNGGFPSVPDQKEWKKEWWKNLARASFPCATVNCFSLPIGWLVATNQNLSISLINIGKVSWFKGSQMSVKRLGKHSTGT